MKKFLIILASLILLLFVGFLVVDESLPEGEPGSKAEELTDEMFAELNKSKWESISFIKWSFRDAHHYVWHKDLNRAKISWDDFDVYLNLDKVEGKAYKSGSLLAGTKKEEAIDKAWSYWCNDSFWLIAPFKARDPGTTRKYVPLSDGLEGLLVQYQSGGVTPGDAYLWALDKDGVPQYYKMWGSSIPIGGVKATWSNWKEFQEVKIATEHKLGPLNIPVENIQAGNSLEQIGLSENLFSKLGS